MKKLSFFLKIITSLIFLLSLITSLSIQKTIDVNNYSTQVSQSYISTDQNTEQEIVDRYIDEDYGVIYTLNHTDKTATATGFNDVQRDKTKFVIQNAVVANGQVYQVKEIADRAFFKKKIYGDIIIGDLVEEIKKNAFYSCDNRNNLYMSNNIVNIEDSAFSRNYFIGELEFGTRYKNSGLYAFHNSSYDTVLKFRYHEDGYFVDTYGSFDENVFFIPPKSDASLGVNRYIHKYEIKNKKIPVQPRQVTIKSFESWNLPMVYAAMDGIDKYMKQEDPSIALSVNENAANILAKDVTIQNLNEYVNGVTNVQLHENVRFYVKEVKPLVKNSNSILVTLGLDVNVNPSNKDYEAIIRMFDGAERSIVLSGFMEHTKVINNTIDVSNNSAYNVLLPSDIVNNNNLIKQMLFDNREQFLKNLPNNFSKNSFLDGYQIYANDKNGSITINFLNINNYINENYECINDATTNNNKALQIEILNIVGLLDSDSSPTTQIAGVIFIDGYSNVDATTIDWETMKRILFNNKHLFLSNLPNSFNENSFFTIENKTIINRVGSEGKIVIANLYLSNYKIINGEVVNANTEKNAFLIKNLTINGFFKNRETKVVGHEINLPQSIDIMNIPIDEIKIILYDNRSSILKNLPYSFNASSFLNLTKNNITRNQENGTIHIKDLWITDFYKKEGNSIYIESTTNYRYGLYIGEVNIKTAVIDEKKNKNQLLYLIIGAASAGALLLIIVITIIVIVKKKRHS